MTTSSASGYGPVLGVSSPRSGEAACSTGCRSPADCRLGSPKRSTTQVRLAAVATSPTRPRARCAIRRSFGQAARSSGFLGSRARRMHASPRAQAPTHLSAGLPTPPPLPIRPRRSPRSGEAVESDLSGSCPAISSDALRRQLARRSHWLVLLRQQQPDRCDLPRQHRPTDRAGPGRGHQRPRRRRREWPERPLYLEGRRHSRPERADRAPHLVGSSTSPTTSTTLDRSSASARAARPRRTSPTSCSHQYAAETPRRLA
jgi:hypothetical protein